MTDDQQSFVENVAIKLHRGPGMDQSGVRKPGEDDVGERERS